VGSEHVGLQVESRVARHPGLGFGGHRACAWQQQEDGVTIR